MLGSCFLFLMMIVWCGHRNENDNIKNSTLHTQNRKKIRVNAIYTSAPNNEKCNLIF